MIQVTALVFVLGLKGLDVSLYEKNSDEAVKRRDSRSIWAREVVVHSLVKFFGEVELGAGDEEDHRSRGNEHEEGDNHHRHDELGCGLEQIICYKFTNWIHDIRSVYSSFRLNLMMTLWLFLQSNILQ
jgi:hypothetical protein